MKLKTSTLIWTFIWCLFMGITAGSIGIGAIFPSINLIAKPVVCPTGKMDLLKQGYNPYPGTTITTLTWYCVDESTGARTEISLLPISLTAGTIYGLLFFVVVFIGMGMMTSRSASGSQNLANGISAADMEHINRMKTSEIALARMTELKELRAANMISEAEYEKKRAEILNNL